MRRAGLTIVVLMLAAAVAASATASASKWECKHEGNHVRASFFANGDNTHLVFFGVAAEGSWVSRIRDGAVEAPANGHVKPVRMPFARPACSTIADADTQSCAARFIGPVPLEYQRQGALPRAAVLTVSVLDSKGGVVHVTCASTAP
jgi:hypothetical protein